jgi:uncharacterized DUF497 family protein
MRLHALDISERTLEKIERKHGVVFDDVEEVCLSRRIAVRRGREGLHRVFGRTSEGRYLLVVLSYHSPGRWTVVTARDMLAAERRLYGRK